ncbi:aminoacyl-tRNA hydrolase [Paracoccus pacificus]|uniref:Peptidyl-tRNA hydrolase n=1 Tax=Paracoccus pacificus TaxID=1463598 RepID=A0ABW4R6B8_9RHOB
MRLIVGLGNPGERFTGNRHNIGFMAIDRIADDHGLGPWKARFQGLLAEGRIGSQRVALLKPQTFMNLSGQSVGEAMRYLKLAPSDVVVIHDELDLAPGKARMKLGGGHAGHNGLRSIHQHIGEGYHRLRLGIGHPGHKDRVTGYVLGDFAKADQAWLDDLLRGVSDAAGALASGDDARVGTTIAARTNPARNGSDKSGGDKKGSNTASADKTAGDAPAPDRVAGAGKPAQKTSAKPAAKPGADAAPEPSPEVPESLAQKLRALAGRFT